MNTAGWKEFIKTPKGKLTLALCAMLLSWIFLFLNFGGSLLISMPSAGRKNQVKQEIRKLRTELKLLEEKKLQAERQKKRWNELAMQCWQPQRDGDPELILRQKIEAAAKKSELKLNNLGTVRLTRINQDFSFAELDISASTKIVPLTAFIHEIQQLKPAVSWRRFSVFTIMRRPRPNNNRSVSTNTQDDNLNFSGNLRMLVYHPENTDGKANSGIAGKKRNTKNSASDNDGGDLPPPNRFGGPPPFGGPRP